MSYRAGSFRVQPYDSLGASAQALTDAKSYADSLAGNYDAAGAASVAESNAKAYADSLAPNYDAAGAAAAASAQAESNAKAYADSLAPNYDASGAAAAAQSAAQAYADQKVADLVSTAPEILDTLGEIATALGNDANLASTLTASIAAKADQTTVDALDARVAATEAINTAQDAALDALLGPAGALNVEKAVGSGEPFVYVVSKAGGGGGGSLPPGT